jgi:hypothetical protein
VCFEVPYGCVGSVIPAGWIVREGSRAAACDGTRSKTSGDTSS